MPEKGFLSLFAGKRRMLELLWALGQHEPVYTYQLINIGWQGPTVSRLLEAMKKDGLVEYEFELRQGRAVKWIRLTPKGRKVLEHLQAANDILEEDGPLD